MDTSSHTELAEIRVAAPDATAVIHGHRLIGDDGASVRHTPFGDGPHDAAEPRRHVDPEVP